MAQTWTSNCFAVGNDWDDDLQAMENNHLALQSSFSGASAPTSPVQGQLWEDTGSGALKKYDGAAWMAVLQGDANLKIPVYRNDTCDGWTIDATVSDRVIAIKGGSGAYNANGGTNAGETWANLKAHTHTGLSHTHSVSITTNQGDNQQRSDCCGSGTGISRSLHTHSVSGNTGSAGTGNTGAQSTSDVRPQACLCTMQHPDLS